jgi:hypothetical protein
MAIIISSMPTSDATSLPILLITITTDFFFSQHLKKYPDKFLYFFYILFGRA